MYDPSSLLAALDKLVLERDGNDRFRRRGELPAWSVRLGAPALATAAGAVAITEVRAWNGADVEEDAGPWSPGCVPRSRRWRGGAACGSSPAR